MEKYKEGDLINSQTSLFNKINLEKDGLIDKLSDSEGLINTVKTKLIQKWWQSDVFIIALIITFLAALTGFSLGHQYFMSQKTLQDIQSSNQMLLQSQLFSQQQRLQIDQFREQLKSQQELADETLKREYELKYNDLILENANKLNDGDYMKKLIFSSIPDECAMEFYNHYSLMIREYKDKSPEELTYIALKNKTKIYIYYKSGDNLEKISEVINTLDNNGYNIPHKVPLALSAEIKPASKLEIRYHKNYNDKLINEIIDITSKTLGIDKENDIKILNAGQEYPSKTKNIEIRIDKI